MHSMKTHDCKSLIRRVEGVGHKLKRAISSYLKIYLMTYLHTGVTDCCGKVTQNCKGMLQGLDSKTLILKQDDTSLHA
jgi:hypothetical protein